MDNIFQQKLSDAISAEANETIRNNGTGAANGDPYKYGILVGEARGLLRAKDLITEVEKQMRENH